MLAPRDTPASQQRRGDASHGADSPTLPEGWADAPVTRGLGFAKSSPEFLDTSTLLSTSLCKLALKYRGSWNKPYKEAVEAIAKQLGPCHEQVLASICIPVAGAQENRKIYDCLKSFAFQTVPGEKFEIALLVNYSAHDAQYRSAEINETISEIKRARIDFPHLQIKLAEYVAPSSKLITIALMRALAADAVIMQAVDCSPQRPDLLIWRCDADTRAVRQTALECYIYLANKAPHVLEFRGGGIWSPEGLEANPRVFGELAAFSLVSMQPRHQGERIPYWWIPNSVVRASAYCWVNGYDLDCKMNAEYDLAKRLVHATRKDNRLSPLSLAGSPTLLVTSNRRACAAALNGTRCNDQWTEGEAGLQIDDHDVRARTEGGGVTNSAATDTVDLRAQIKQGAREDLLYRNDQLLNVPHLLSLLGGSSIEAMFRQYTKLDDGLISRMHVHQSRSPLRPEIPDRIKPVSINTSPKPRVLNDPNWTKNVKLELERILRRNTGKTPMPTIHAEDNQLVIQSSSRHVLFDGEVFRGTLRLTAHEVGGKKFLNPSVYAMTESGTIPAGAAEPLRCSQQEWGEMQKGAQLVMMNVLEDPDRSRLINLSISGVAERLATFVIREYDLVERVKQALIAKRTQTQG